MFSIIARVRKTLCRDYLIDDDVDYNKGSSPTDTSRAMHNDRTFKKYWFRYFLNKYYCRLKINYFRSQYEKSNDIFGL